MANPALKFLRGVWGRFFYKKISPNRFLILFHTSRDFVLIPALGIVDHNGREVFDGEAADCFGSQFGEGDDLGCFDGLA